VPGFNIFRGIGRFGLIFAFAFSLSAAYGFDYFINNADSEKVKKFLKYFMLLISGFILLWLLYQIGLFKGITNAYKDAKLYDNSTLQLLKTILILLVLLAFIILFKKRSISQHITLLLFILLAFIDLYIFGSKHNSCPATIEEIYINKEAIKAIKEDYNTELYRVKCRTPENLFVFDQNQGMIDFIFMLDGYNPLNLKDRFPPHRENDLMNVKLVATWDEGNNTPTFIFNETYVPRAWMTYRPIVENSLEKVAKILEDSTFDIATNVIIDQEPEIPINGNVGKYSIMLSEYSINKIVLDVKTNENGILVLSEVYYPNWKVFIDDVEKPMLRCYYSLRGVSIEKGEHTVVFKYIDKDFQIGAIISLIALTIIITGFLTTIIKTKKAAR
jgi:Ca2+/Na+ antiporter